jgi:hypothetical protein
MKPSCKNHLGRGVYALDLCQSCYNKQRTSEPALAKSMCNTHPDRAAYAKNMCQSCYMKARRAQSHFYVGRKPIGSTVAVLMTAGGWEADFLSRIDNSAGEDACHPWTSVKNKGGYGSYTKCGYTVLAHRLRKAMADPNSIDAPVIMHACDNPQCCNPRHLIAGSYAENTQDMYRKGRNNNAPADHLRDRPNHPMAKPVITPHGYFPSATLAAESIGLHARTVALRCQRGADGWSYR